MDSKGFITVNSSGVLGEGESVVRPRHLLRAQTAGAERGMVSGHSTQFAVNNLVTPSLQAAVGFTHLPHLGFELGLIMPLAIVSGQSTPSDQTANGSKDWTFTAQGIGDLQVHPKIRLMNATRNGIGLAIIPSIIFPTGDKKSFFGEGQTIFQPTAVIDTELGYLGRFRAAINGGMRIRPHSAVFTDNPNAFLNTGDPTASMSPTFMTADITTKAGISIGNEFIGGLGLSYGIVPQKFDLVGEVYGNYGTNSNRLNADGTSSKMGPSAEAIAASSSIWRATRSSSSAAATRWPTATGAARPRAFVGFIFEPSIGDRDGDGYKDDVDQCPDDPEDFDDFEDADGCPDPDNDKDGIPDVDDKCPNDPETKNGYQDADGCPDSTTFDRDGDGIPDDIDKCPDDPEDKDNFEGRRRLPRSRQRQGRHPRQERSLSQRSRGQGRLRGPGRLPRSRQRPRPHPRQGRQVSERAGDLQRLSGRRRLPRQGEGHRPQGQARDPGQDLLRDGQGRDQVVSFPLLDAIAATINGNPQIDLIEIQGHADERGDDAHNLDLTERRAHSVRVALEQRNVLPSRLKSHGYGEDQADLHAAQRRLLEPKSPRRVHHPEALRRSAPPGRRRPVARRPVALNASSPKASSPKASR